MSYVLEKREVEFTDFTPVAENISRELYCGIVLYIDPTLYLKGRGMMAYTTRTIPFWEYQRAMPFSLFLTRNKANEMGVIPFLLLERMPTLNRSWMHYRFTFLRSRLFCLFQQYIYIYIYMYTHQLYTTPNHGGNAFIDPCAPIYI